MKELLLEKFHSNPNLADFLDSTGQNTLCEATVHKFWGIGLTIRAKELWTPGKWQGENQMGKILEDIRQTLKK
jgi:predicted NAD-dependent protein-ADP-ribosyltransferase YbiA (DUF1768 family)